MCAVIVQCVCVCVCDVSMGSETPSKVFSPWHPDHVLSVRLISEGVVCERILVHIPSVTRHGNTSTFIHTHAHTHTQRQVLVSSRSRQNPMLFPPTLLSLWIVMMAPLSDGSASASQCQRGAARPFMDCGGLTSTVRRYTVCLLIV